ncbi:MAG TPA: Fic family protein [Terriglobia bacterium]|nr:Fic family protein [Terriglobia bacterium]
MIYHPSFGVVFEIHHPLIERFGGAHGLRDPGALESALGRPQSGYYRAYIGEASALMESLSQNHPFVDSNKRTSIATGT